jgi:Uncharacterized protein conserved in bacteria
LKGTFRNNWLQLILGLIAGIIGVIASYPLAILFLIKYAGFSSFGFGSNGDNSPITFAVAAIFGILTFTFPTLVWLFLYRFGSLKSGSQRIKVSTFFLFAALPLWIYLGLGTFSQIQNVYAGYRSIREGCTIQNGVNRKTIGGNTRVFECKNGVYNGFTKTYNSQGIMIREGSYLDGKLNGTQTVYYEDGGINIRTTYRNGKKEGTEIYYNEDGSIYLYVPSPQEKSGQAYYQRPEKYFVRNNLDLENQNFYCQNQGMDSLRNYRYTCLNNVLNSEFIKYDSKGNAELRIKFTNGVLDGIYEQFIDGNLYIHLEFRNGKLDGKAQLYSPEGNLEYDGQYVNGLQNGIFRMYDDQGNLVSDVVFEYGKLVKINK